MHNLLDADQVGAPLPEHAVTAERQQGMYADPEVLRVSDARQVRWPRVGDAERVVHRQHSPDAGQGVARLIDVRQVVRQGVVAKQEPLLDDR
jgi:hypothetical protein